MGSHSKGTRRERQLLDEIREAGYGGVRIPASGSATDEELPDLLVGRPRGGDDASAEVYAIEAKYSASRKKIYLDRDEVKALEGFATAFGAIPLVAARWSTHLEGVSDAEWWIRPTWKLYETEKNYRAAHSDAVDHWEQLPDWL